MTILALGTGKFKRFGNLCTNFQHCRLGTGIPWDMGVWGLSWEDGTVNAILRKEELGEK
jgi:hypothetical protein